MVNSYESNRSLEEFGGLSGHLEFGDQFGHEPVVVGPYCEVHVRLTLHIVEVSDLSSDLTGVRLALFVSADMVLSAGEEGHGDRVDLGHVDQVSLSATIVPIGNELLEAVFKSVLEPVLSRHDRRTL